MTPQTFIGYTRVSTDEQASSGLGLTGQAEMIRDECQRQGWQLADVVTDAGYSAKTLDRPELQDALARLARGEADGLIVAKLDRLTRSVADFVAVADWTLRAEVTLVVIGSDFDTSTASGRMIAQMFAVFAEFERELIRERTRDALAVLKAQGKAVSRPAVAQTRPELAGRIQGMRDGGMTLQAIADTLNDEGVPTVRGGAIWRHSAVQTVLGYRRPPAVKAAAVLPEVGRKPRRRGGRAA